MKILKIILIILINLIAPILLVGIVQFFMLIILGIDLKEEAKVGWLAVFYTIAFAVNSVMLCEGIYHKMLRD